jgi:hypothetical protein
LIFLMLAALGPLGRGAGRVLLQGLRKLPSVTAACV